MSVHSYRRIRRAIAATCGATLAAVTATVVVGAPAHAANGVPRYDHVVLVMEENHGFSSIIGSGTGAPYINNTLAAGGALFTNSFAIEHPSEPNYLDLFSGSNQGITSDICPTAIDAPNEGAQLLKAGDTWTSYSEDLPSAGSTTCASGAYASKHNPWVNFQLAPSTSANHLPSTSNLPFTSFPSSASFSSLPTVSWVVPNLNNDMHDGTVQQGDTWLQSNMDAYAQWAKTHNSLLIVTWDEDDSSGNNQIATIFYGAGVKTGRYGEQIDHFSVLRTLEDMYGLPYAGAAANATPITDVWNAATGNTVTVANPGTQTGTVGTAASLQAKASDSASGQTLTYSATGLPAGLSINSSTGLISGTPTSAGSSSVTVTATDTTGAHGSAAFTWTVNAAANFTLAASPISGTVTAGGKATTTVSTTAVGGFAGSVALSASGLPSGATASFSPASVTAGGSSTLTITTSASTPAGTSTVTVTGTSGSLTHSAAFSLKVNPVGGNTVNVTNPGTQTGTVGTAASLQVKAADSASGQTLTYSAASLPAGLSINSSTGVISGTPTTAGSSSVTVTATDTTGAHGSAAFTWTVNAASGNPVTVANPGPQTSTVGTAVSLQIQASDSTPGQTLAYGASGLPDGLSIDSGTGVISGTPSTVGTYSSLVLAEDTTGQYDYVTFDWTVNPAGAGNTVTVTNPGTQTGTVGTAVTLQIQASDSASGQTLAYGASGLPAGLSINSSTGVISGTPTAAGTYSVTVVAQDTTGVKGNAAFSWTVNPAGAGNMVTVTNPGAQSGNVWTPISLQIQASDSASGKALTYSATGLPAGLSINSATGLISGTPTASSSTTVTVTATDATGAKGSTAFALTVTYNQGVWEMFQNGLAVADPGSSPTAGTQLVAGTQNGGLNQQWGFTSNSDGTFLVENLSSHMCIDVAGSSTASGAAITQSNCTDNADQRWTLLDEGSGIALVNAKSNLYLTASGTVNQSKLIQQPGVTTQQIWTFNQVS